MSGREDRNPPDEGDDGRGGDREDCGENWPGRGGGSSGNWPSGRTRCPKMSFVMMLVCWKLWRLCCRRQRLEGERSSIHAIRKRVNFFPKVSGGELS